MRGFPVPRLRLRAPQLDNKNIGFGAALPELVGMTLIFVDSPIISQGAPRQRGLEDRSNTLALLKNRISQGAFETNHVLMNIKAVELEAGIGRGRELNPAVIHLCDAETHCRVLYSVESIFPEGLDCVVNGEFARSHQLRCRQARCRNCWAPGSMDWWWTS